MERTIGLDIHKRFAEVAVLHRGSKDPKRLRLPATAPAIRAFAVQLGSTDQVALESCTNAFAFQRLLCQHAGQVVVSNPLKTRIIAEAKVKTDKVDAETLARLLAADFLPPVWVPDPNTDYLRHLVFHRQGLVGQRTQAKNRVHAVLHRNLLAPEVSDLFGKKGRDYLAQVELPSGERELLEADLRVIEFLDTEIRAAERSIAKAVHEDPDVRRLMTIPGIAFTSAAALRAAIGDVKRFKAPGRLVSYFGLNPSVHQSGDKAYTGSITRRGRSHARSVLVEAAHQLVKTPGPFRAFFVRLRRRKTYNVAITAVARKLAVLVWHMLSKGEDYHWSPPALTRQKLNTLRYVATGQRRRGNSDDPPAPDRTLDKKPGKQAEDTYHRFILRRFGPSEPSAIEHPNRASSKQPTPPKKKRKKTAPKKKAT